MITRNVVRRLERFEAYVAPPSDEPALIIHLTGIGHPDRIIEVHGDNTADRRRRPCSPRRTIEMRAINTRTAVRSSGTD
jgi:hypothetical protein